MKNVRPALAFLLGQFLPRVALEFIWLLFSVLLGMAIMVSAAKVPTAIANQAAGDVGRFILILVFNAAMLRVILHYGLTWLDKQLDQVLAGQMDFLKRQVHFAATMLKKTPKSDN